MRTIILIAVLPVAVLAASCAQQPDTFAGTAVAKIAFVDQAVACKCTMTRIENSWKALQSIIGGSKIPVERVHLDKDEETADRYDDMASLVVPPGIYFLDSGGALIKMVQGEVTVKQIRDVLQTRKR